MEPLPSAVDIFRNKLYESALPNEFPNALCSNTETTLYFPDQQTTSFTINVEGTEFTVTVSAFESDIIATLDLTAQLKLFSCHFHFSAVRQIGGLKSFLDFDDTKVTNFDDGTKILEYRCEKVLVEKENGFMNDNGGFTIRFQINITRLDNKSKNKANLFDRLLRLDEAFTAKKFLNRSFANVLQTAKQELADLKSNESFLEYCSSQKQLLQLDRKEFLDLLKARLETDLLFDIAATSSVLYIFSPVSTKGSSKGSKSKGSSKGSTSKVSTKGSSELPIFVKGDKTQTIYMLSGTFVDVCGMVESLHYKPVPKETNVEWTSTNIAALEQTIFKSGCQVFQSFFVSEVAKKVYNMYASIRFLSDLKLVQPVKKSDPVKAEKEEEEREKSEKVVQEEPIDVDDEKVIDVDEKAYREALANAGPVQHSLFCVLASFSHISVSNWLLMQT